MDPPVPPEDRSSLPGPSRIRKECSYSLRKKRKINNDEEIDLKASTTIDDLPDDMLIEIFCYLSIEERLIVQGVCSRWRQLVRSEIFWKYVKFSEISVSLFIKILNCLPSCVSHFECRWKYFRVMPISLPNLLVTIHQQCPSLKTLILENLDFRHINGDNIDFSPQLKMLQVARRKRKTSKSKSCKDDDLSLLSTILPELQVLSFKKTFFYPSHFYPYIFNSDLHKIRILDLSHSKPITEPKFEIKDDLFSTLVNVEELYLAGWNITDDSLLTFLKNVKKLRILDVEFSSISDRTISALIQNSAWLEELYLCFTDITSIRKTSKMKLFFPRLQSLCVKDTSITQKNIEELLFSVPSLKYVQVSYSNHITKKWYADLSKDLKKRVMVYRTDVIYCRHYFKHRCWSFLMDRF